MNSKFVKLLNKNITHQFKVFLRELQHLNKVTTNVTNQAPKTTFL